MSTESLVSVHVTEDSPAVLDVTGELDVATVPELDDVRAAFAGHDVVVDLSGVGFMDSTGIATLLMALKRSRKTGRSFPLRSPPPPVLRVLQVSGVDKMFTIEA